MAGRLQYIWRMTVTPNTTSARRATSRATEYRDERREDMTLTTNRAYAQEMIEMANKNEKSATETPVLKTLKTKHLAAKFHMTAMQLRRVLRSMPAYADGVHTKYAWSENDTKAIAEIENAIKSIAEKKEKAKQAAQAALKAKEAEKKAQEQADKKAA